MGRAGRQGSGVGVDVGVGVGGMDVEVGRIGSAVWVVGTVAVSLITVAAVELGELSVVGVTKGVSVATNVVVGSWSPFPPNVNMPPATTKASSDSPKRPQTIKCLCPPAVRAEVAGDGLAAGGGGGCAPGVTSMAGAESGS